MTLNLLELSLGWDEEKLKRQLSLPYFMFCHAEKKADFLNYGGRRESWAQLSCVVI